MVPTSRAALTVLSLGAFIALTAWPSAAHAQERHNPHQSRWRRPPRTVTIGVAPHVVASIGSACSRGADVVECSDFLPFAGAEATVHYWPLDFLGIGARFAGSKDLDGAEGTNGDITWDPEDQFLWRLGAELRLDVPILPIFIGAHGGLALLAESQESLDSNDEIREASETRAAPMAGLIAGIDLWLGKQFTLTPEVRGSLIAFGEPPEFRTDVEGRDYGSSAWFDLVVRLSYVIP